MQQGKRYAVFSIRERKNGESIWTRAGAAWVNKDGSLNLVLDVLPLDGRLHVREAVEKRDERPQGLGAPAPQGQAQGGAYAQKSAGGDQFNSMDDAMASVGAH